MTIALRDLTKVYGRLKAVDGIDLDIGEGEVLCLLGPSGCGKTTTLRMVAGLEWATGGDILLGGERVNDRTARERNVAMSFQFYALYPNLTVAENLAYPLWAEGHTKAVVRRKVQATADRLRLGSIMDRLPGQLAEGEKQRVAVGRSIVRDPACFLFDEPLSRLDVQLREEMRGEIKGVLQGLKRPTVIVTHDQLEALTMADRIAVMRAGVIEQVADPEQKLGLHRPHQVHDVGRRDTQGQHALEGATGTRVGGIRPLPVPRDGGVDPTVVVFSSHQRPGLSQEQISVELR